MQEAGFMTCSPGKLSVGQFCQFSQSAPRPALCLKLLEGVLAASAVLGDDFIPVELYGGQHSLFYSPFPFRLHFSRDSNGIA